MAGERETSQDRTEEATPKRKRDSQRKGQVARSRELGTAAVLMASAITFLAVGDRIVGDIGKLMTAQFTLAADISMPAETALAGFVESVQATVVTIAPLLAVTAVAGVLAALLIGGWVLSAGAVSFKVEKLDPIRGLRRMVSLQALMELGKALAKFALITCVSVGCLFALQDRIFALGWMSFDQAVMGGTRILLLVFLVLCSATLIIASVDAPFQMWNHLRNLKMTKQEVKDEMKETDGRPEVKGRVRQLQREVAQRRMMEAVPKADVVVVNPTRFAAALRYDAARMASPVLVAKGAGPVAARIREVADSHGVEIVHIPALARSLYFNVEIGRPIPVGLYLAVARTLAYVIELRETARGERRRAGPPEVDIPEALRADDPWPVTEDAR